MTTANRCAFCQGSYSDVGARSAEVDLRGYLFCDAPCRDWAERYGASWLWRVRRAITRIVGYPASGRRQPLFALSPDEILQAAKDIPELEERWSREDD